MKNKWDSKEALNFVKKYQKDFSKELCILTYATRLIGSEPSLAMHGGGNTSIKCFVDTLIQKKIPAIFIKASGCPLDTIEPNDFVCLNLILLKKLMNIKKLNDQELANEFKIHTLKPTNAIASIETLMHAFLDFECIIHTHPSAILALTNRKDNKKVLKKAFKKNVLVLDYINAGLELAKATFNIVKKNKNARGIIVINHGLITWGKNIQEAYNATIDIVNDGENFLNESKTRVISVSQNSNNIFSNAQKRYISFAPIIRNILSQKTNDFDNPFKKVVLYPLISKEILEFLSFEKAKNIFNTPPLTPDYCVRTKSFSLWIDNTYYDNLELFKSKISAAVSAFSQQYSTFAKKICNINNYLDFLPKVIFLPGIGIVCCDMDIKTASMIGDITLQALKVKKDIYETGGEYKTISEKHLLDMEFRDFQTAKIKKQEKPLSGQVALVTGALGAIGSAICEELLENGCHVIYADLPGDRLEYAAKEIKKIYGLQAGIIGIDVTNPLSVKEGFAKCIETYGGIDIVVSNAGIAHVSALTEMQLDSFKKLEAVNVEGTLNVFSEAGKIFKLQNMGGDIILISTKNVFSPGAKFGAYSATKAAAHQLARIASLEFAEIGVRVNMVSPDAVFSHGTIKSGLWQEVGPERMKARGLSEKELEEYYQNRNLLKAKVMAKHVAKAVLFFVTHQTPTTGATLPVDGGLPDATPR
jgi:rhamnose utilization protein RhaD (predicted bifunctional aldolase and dehydrogenase)/NAD(P)-dependent dehydrogenase (short-subunit alcohol dehydrogenase family)